MAGPIQKAASNLVGTAAAITAAGKKLSEDEKQASAQEAAKAKSQAEAAAAVQKEAQEASLEADLINLGADPESARAFMEARSLGLNTKKFGMIRKNGKFAGSYSSIAEKLSKDSLTDSLSSRVINEKGFAERVIALGGTRRGRVDALVRASKGGQK